MTGLPPWMDVLLLAACLVSLVCAGLLKVRPADKEDQVGWKIVAVLAIPTVILIGAIAMMALSKRQSPTPSLPPAEPVIDHEAAAKALREHVEEEGRARARYVTEEATEDEVAALGAARFGDGDDA